MPCHSLTDIVRVEQILPVERAIDLLAALLRSRLNNVEIHGQITPDRVLISSEAPTRIEILPIDRIGIDPEFSAPEVIDGKVSNSSDIYSIGLITIYLLTGIRPFQLIDPIEQRWIWQDYWYQVSHSARINYPKLVKLLDRAIDLNPARRFSSTQEMLIALQACYPTLALPPANWYCCHTLTGEPCLHPAVTATAIDPLDRIVATGSEDKTIRLWDIQTGKQIATLTGHQKSVLTLAFDPNIIDRLFSSGKDGQIKLWQVDEERELISIDSGQPSINSLAISPDGRFLVTAGSDRTIKVWDTHTLSPLISLRQHKLSVNGLAFNPIEHDVKFASVSSDRQVILWGMEQKTPLAILLAHTQAVKAIAFSPDGKLLATGGDDGFIRVWDVERRQLQSTLSGHGWTVSALSFLPDGNTLISGSWDGNIKFWQLNTGREIDCLTAHEVEILAVASSGAGYIITGSRDRTAKIWRSLLGVEPRSV